MTLENITFCILAIVLHFKLGMKTPSEMSATERFVLSYSALAGYGLLACSIISFGERGHHLFDGIPYLLVTGLLLCNFNLLTCLFLWPLTSERSPRSFNDKSIQVAQTHEQSVVVLVPTRGEPISILRATLNACMAMDYNRFSVVVLDDSHRLEIQELAVSAGCQYLARDDRIHAKAGNLNFGLNHTDSDLVAVFDADCIPEKNFLQATTHWFSDPSVAIVQTPQFMRLAEPIGRALGVEDQISESDVFYGFNQPVYGLFDAPICCGTACVFRRDCLNATGGFFTSSATEDYYTGICVSALGYRIVYTYQKLSAGLPATSVASYIEQRKRWARGTIQGLRTPANPLRISGLQLWQRVGHFLSLSSWLREPVSVALQLLGLGLAIGGTNWISASWSEVLLSIVPMSFLTNNLVRIAQGNRISRRYAAVRSAIVDWSIARSVIIALLYPRTVEFNVSQKCTEAGRFERVRLETYATIIIVMLLSAWGAYSCLQSLIPFYDRNWLFLLDSQQVFMASASLIYSLEILAINLFALSIASKR